ncbi:MAG: glycosyltransferase family 9 protein [Gemmatimonadota bacterium]
MKPPTLSLDPGEIRSALFVRLRRFGDTIVLGACVRLFKRWAPHARLTVLVQPGYDALLRPLREIDEFVIAERGAAGALGALARVRKLRPDLTVDFHGNLRAAFLTWASGARVKVGERRFHWPVYDVRVPHAELLFGIGRRTHTLENHLALLAAIGVPTPAEPLDLPVPEGAARSAAERLARAGIPGGPRAILFPATTLRGKQWPVERWFRLASRLAGAWEGVVLLMFEGSDLDLAARARGEARGAHVLVDMPLAELAALVATSELVVSHDSLGAHLAAAYGAPSVVLYGGTDPAEYFPWMAETVILRVHGLPCSPCGGRDCRSPVYPWACIDGLDEEVAFETALDWLLGGRMGAVRLPVAAR